MPRKISLEVRAISGQGWKAGSPGAGGQRELDVCKLMDTTTCIGCKACEVACVEWNDLPFRATTFDNTYQTMPETQWNFWQLIKFNEAERDAAGSLKEIRDMEAGGSLMWVFRKHQCMHCMDPGCLRACPADGAIVQYTNGIVDIQQENCIGCQLCVSGCPFDIPRFNQKTKKVYKCTLCSDRVAVGLEPACIKACPTGCLQFGSKSEMKQAAEKRTSQLREDYGFSKAGIWDPETISGTHVIYVLHDAEQPQLYGLPDKPKIPAVFTLWKYKLKPLSFLAVLMGIAGLGFHYVRYGPRRPQPQQSTGGATPVFGRRRALADGSTMTGDLPRYSAYTRILHWIVALFFILALLSGFALFNPWLYHLLPPLFGGGPTARLLHPWIGSAFFLTMLLLFRNRRPDMQWTPGDTSWLRRLRAYVTNQEKAEPPDVGKYNAGQKLWFWLMFTSGVVFAITGIFLWFPEMFGRTPARISHLFHDIAALALLGGFAIHAYEGTIGVSGSLRAMIRGTVTAAWAKANHPAWYRQITGREQQNERTRAMRRSR